MPKKHPSVETPATQPLSALDRRRAVVFTIGATSAFVVTMVGAVIYANRNAITSRIQRVFDERALASSPEAAVKHFRKALLGILDDELTEMSERDSNEWKRFCKAGEDYENLGESKKAGQAFSECADKMPADEHPLTKIKTYRQSKDHKKVLEALQEFIDNILKHNAPVWPEHIEEFAAAYSQYENPKKVKQTLIELGNSLIDQLKTDNHTDVNAIFRCYELSGMDADEIYLRLSVGLFKAGQVERAAWFFRIAVEEQCTSGSEDMKTFARSIAGQALLGKWPNGAREVMEAAGIDKKEIAKTLAEYILALPIQSFASDDQALVDSEELSSYKYIEAQELLQESGMPDKEICEALAVQAEKDEAFATAAQLYEKLGNNQKAQKNYAKAAEQYYQSKHGKEGAFSVEWQARLFRKAGLEKEAKAVEEEHKKTVAEKAEILKSEGYLYEAAKEYLSIGEKKKARAIAKELVESIKGKESSIEDRKIEEIAGLCNAVGDRANHYRLLISLIEKITAGPQDTIDFYRLGKLYKNLGWNSASEFAYEIARRQSASKHLDKLFADTSTEVDEVIDTLNCSILFQCGEFPDPQNALTTVARRFFEAGNFENAALAFHALGDTFGLDASLEAMKKKCEEDNSPQCYKDLAKTYKTLGEEDLAKQYYLLAAQAYLEEAEETTYAHEKKLGYQQAAKCYHLAGENNPPPNNPVLLACMHDVEEFMRENREDGETTHNGVETCVGNLASTINLTEEEAEAFLGRHAESTGLYYKAANHYTDAGMPYDAMRMHAYDAEWKERESDTGSVNWYEYASNDYEKAGDLDSALRTSVKALADIRGERMYSPAPDDTKPPSHGEEKEELRRILDLLGKKQTYFVDVSVAE